LQIHKIRINVGTSKLNAYKHSLTVGHAQVKGTFVLEVEVLVGKLFAID
jgi:hypothetical protein